MEGQDLFSYSSPLRLSTPFSPFHFHPPWTSPAPRFLHAALRTWPISISLCSLSFISQSATELVYASLIRRPLFHC